MKIKVIEAIAKYCTVVSTPSGACGLPKELCGEQLLNAEDYNWEQFLQCILEAIRKEKKKTPDAIYTCF